MSGERNQYQSRGLDYGSSVAEGNVDFAEDANINARKSGDKALLDRLKDALRPGDARAPSSSTAADTTHDGRHGAAEQVMQPGQRDYDESGVMDAVKDKVDEAYRNSTGRK